MIKIKNLSKGPLSIMLDSVTTSIERTEPRKRADGSRIGRAGVVRDVPSTLRLAPRQTSDVLPDICRDDKHVVALLRAAKISIITATEGELAPPPEPAFDSHHGDDDIHSPNTFTTSEPAFDSHPGDDIHSPNPFTTSE